MKIKLKNKITSLLGATLSFLTACQSDDILTPHYTVGEENNAIVLRAGVAGDGVNAGVETRAMNDQHHTKHTPFLKETQIRLRVDGTWTDHDPVAVKKVTTATLSDKSGTDSKHNNLDTFSPTIYWDDYGMADPANKETGREQGLTIYGAAIDGQTTLPTDLSNNLDNTSAKWKALSWNVGTVGMNPAILDQSAGWSAKDLLTSNNVKAAAVSPNVYSYPVDGTYKFADRFDGKLLEFTHAMTKMTVVLTAGKGFPGYSESTPNEGKFASEPSILLNGFYYIGSVNVEEKISSPTTTATTDIKMHLSEGGKDVHTASFDALVFPGNSFESTANILTIDVDGNVLTVTANELNKAIDAAITNTATTGYPSTAGNHTLLQAWNYKLKILVDKTDVKIEATVKSWDDVTADEEAPKINIDKVYGHPTQTDHPAFQQKFDLYRSTVVDGSYLGTGDHAVVNYEDSKYSMSPQLYWPDHNTHYFFRGVWPVVDSKDGSDKPIGPASTKVHDNTIDVENVAYKQGYYPSDLMIGAPLGTDDKTLDETCKVHTSPKTQGICATEGKVHINFRYMMSQVEVELKTVDSPDAAKVNIGQNTVVELVNVYNSGEAKFSDVSVVTTGVKGNYTLGVVSGSGNELKRHSAIVPQTLTYTTAGAETNLRFKVTVTNNDAVLYADAAEYNAAKSTSLDDAAFAALSDAEKTKTPATIDIYYADVNPILKSGSTTEKVAPKGKWESGVHYKYVLTLSKTALTVTATLKDWVTVEASTVVWF